jgi:hypothetical protein
MNLKKLSLKQLKKLKEEYRPEATSQVFFIFALIASAMLSESFSIIHEYVKEFHRDVYNEWAWVVTVLGIFFAIATVIAAYLISIRDHNKIYDEIERRSRHKKKK